MKSNVLILSVLALCTFSGLASAHPNHPKDRAIYSVFWKNQGIQSRASTGADPVGQEIWRYAFVSSYQIVGESLTNNKIEVTNASNSSKLSLFAR